MRISKNRRPQNRPQHTMTPSHKDFQKGHLIFWKAPYRESAQPGQTQGKLIDNRVVRTGHGETTAKRRRSLVRAGAKVLQSLGKMIYAYFFIYIHIYVYIYMYIMYMFLCMYVDLCDVCYIYIHIHLHLSTYLLDCVKNLKVHVSFGSVFHP